MPKLYPKNKNTNQKQINRNNAADETVSSILNSIGEAVVTLDNKFYIKTFNPLACQLTGYRESETIGKLASDILLLTEEKTGKKLIWPFLVVLKNGKIIKLTNHSNLITKDKQEFPIAYSISPLKDDANKTIGLILVFRDVTHEREVQKMKSEFVSIVSHQLRTPASAVKWYLETLMDNRKGEKMNKWQIEHIQQAYQSNERMIHLINDLLNVSRIESGKLKIDLKTVTIYDLVKSVMDEIANFARANNVELVCNINSKKQLKVNVDAEKVRQVIQNLISNAIKYTRPGKQQVIVDAFIAGKFLKVSVQDHGVGIPQDQQKRMFEKFFRAENAITMQTEGSGLGLYIAKKIVNLHKGEIWLESQIQKGTTFYFTLPLAK